MQLKQSLLKYLKVDFNNLSQDLQTALVFVSYSNGIIKLQLAKSIRKIDTTNLPPKTVDLEVTSENIPDLETLFKLSNDIVINPDNTTTINVEVDTKDIKMLEILQFVIETGVQNLENAYNAQLKNADDEVARLEVDIPQLEQTLAGWKQKIEDIKKNKSNINKERENTMNYLQKAKNLNLI